MKKLLSIFSMLIISAVFTAVVSAQDSLEDKAYDKAADAVQSASALGFSIGLGLGLNLDGNGMTMTAIMDGEEGTKNIMGEKALWEEQRIKTAAGVDPAPIEIKSLSGGMMGISPGLNLKLNYSYGFLRTGFYYDFQVTESKMELEFTPGDEADYGGIRHLEGEKFVQQWNYTRMEVPVVLGIQVPVSKNFNVYMGLGVSYLSGTWGVKFEAPAGLFLADGMNYDWDTTLDIGKNWVFDEVGEYIIGEKTGSAVKDYLAQWTKDNEGSLAAILAAAEDESLVTNAQKADKAKVDEEVYANLFADLYEITVAKLTDDGMLNKAGKEEIEFNASGIGITWLLGVNAEVTDNLFLFLEYQSTAGGGMEDALDLSDGKHEVVANALGSYYVAYPVNMSAGIFRFGLEYKLL